jgi:hypothetical protein
MRTVEYPAPLDGGEIIATPSRIQVGTTTLVVVKTTDGRFQIEAACLRHGNEGPVWRAQRVVFVAKSKREIRAWFAGREFNPGGPVGTPVGF